MLGLQLPVVEMICGQVLSLEWKNEGVMDGERTWCSISDDNNPQETAQDCVNSLARGSDLL